MNVDFMQNQLIVLADGGSERMIICSFCASRDSSVCRQLISLCSSSSPDLPPSCSGLLHLLDSQTEEQRIDLGLAVLEPSIGTTQSTTAHSNKVNFSLMDTLLPFSSYRNIICMTALESIIGV